MRSIVFSGFSDEYFEEEIGPKLKAVGVDVVRVVRPEGDAFLDSTDFDSFIIFQDMTIKSQQDLIKEFAKKCKKPFTSLSRRNPNFDNELFGAVKKINNSIAPPSSAKVASMVKATVDLITNPNPASVPALQEDTSLIQDLERSLGEKNKLITELSDMVELYEKDNEQLICRLKEKEEMVRDLKSEKELLLVEYNKSRAEYMSLTERLESLSNRQNNGDNICQEIAAIRVLNKDGILSDSETLERLLLIGEESNVA